MSTNTTTYVDVTLDTTAVEVKEEHNLVTSNAHPICATPNQEITAKKKEYSIVGDAYYASTYSGGTPTWLSDLIDARVGTAVQDGLTDYDLLVQDVRNAIDSIDVAKNTFVEEVSFQQRVDGIVGVHIDTLNATHDNKFATIVNLDIVEANAAFARATQANDIKIAYEDYTDARITAVQQAYADADSALADDITALDVRIDDQESGLTATAAAVSGLQTFVGIDQESAYPNGTGMLARVGLLEKQSDGFIEYLTGTYDVMLGVEDSNSDTSNDELRTDALPYVLWTTIVGSGIPASTLRDYMDYSLETPTIAQTQILEGTLYERTDFTNNDVDKYYQYSSENGWTAITEAQFKTSELALRFAHAGDVYVQYSTNASGVKEYLRGYKFIKTAKDLSAPYSGDSDGFTWALITDTDAQSAYMAAINAQDLADSKRRVFVVEPFPPYDLGDLWVDSSSNPQIIKVAQTAQGMAGSFSTSHWVLADEMAKDFIDNTYTPDSAQLHRQLDGKIEYMFLETYNDAGFSLVDVSGAASEADTLDLIDDQWSTPELKDAANGNIVYFMDSENAYWYQASTPAWIAVVDTSLYKALKDAATAQGAADGKVSQFYAWGGTSAPADYDIVTTPEELDDDSNVIQAEVTETVSATEFLYWFKADNKLYHKSDSDWVEVPTTPGSGQYISKGDIVVVFDPVEHDTTAYSFNGTDWNMTGPNGIISKSKWFVDLDNDVRGDHGYVAKSMNDLEISANLYADNKSLSVENKFAYDSKIILDGKYYEAGFGLDSSGVTQVNDGLTEDTAFDSEFWVNAERFVLKSPSHPSVQATFKVSETGIVLGLENTEATRNEPRGAYSADATYLKGDIVTYNGSSFVALKTLTGVVPVHGTDWSLLAAAGDSPLLYDWDGVLNWPTSTNEAGASVISFNSDFPGNTTIRIEATDAEGGLRVKFNDADEEVLSGPDNATRWYTFHYDNLVAGNNTLKVWSTTPDGGSIKKIKVAFVGATGASGEGTRSATILVHSADLDGDTYEDAIASIGTYWAAEASSPFVDPVAGDSLVLTNTDPINGWTHIFGFDGTGWVVRSAFTVNGDMIVDGTVVSNALASDIIIGKDATFEGKVELVGTTHKRVSSATPFGSANQFIEWFGLASIAEDDMSEGNAITYLKTDGSAYFGGAIISGALSTSSTTSSLGTSETVEIGPFGSNGGIIAINCSVSMNSSRHYGLYDNQQTIPPAPGAPSCTLTLEEYVSGSWVHRQTASYTGTGYNNTFRWDGEHSTYEGSSYQSLSGSFTFTDSKQTTANRTYRLKMTNRTGLSTLGDWNASQRVSINAQE